MTNEVGYCCLLSIIIQYLHLACRILGYRVHHHHYSRHHCTCNCCPRWKRLKHYRAHLLIDERNIWPPETAIWTLRQWSAKRKKRRIYNKITRFWFLPPMSHFSAIFFTFFSVHDYISMSYNELFVAHYNNCI